MSKRQILTVVGKTGRGKSFFTKEYLVPEIAKNEPVIIADSMAEYTAGTVYKSFEGFYSAVKEKGKLEGVSIVQIKSDSDAKKLFAFCAKCEAKHCLVIEEASKYCTPHSVDEFINSIVAYGRHFGVSAVFSAQRFAQLNKIITSQTDIFVTFQQTEQVDLKALSNYFNETEKIKSLEKQQFVMFGDLPESSKIEANAVLKYNAKTKKIDKV